MEMNIYAYKCKKCGHVQYPYRTLCRNCHQNEHAEFDIVPLAKKGKLVTFTTLYTLPSDFETVTITLGIVELEDGNKMTGQLNIEKPEIGMAVQGEVKVVRHDQYNKFLGMVFSKA
jgi:uncharacterized OB-fold protein